MKSWVPPKKKAIVALLAGVLAVVLCFAALLRYSWRAVVTVNPSGYAVEAPEDFRYTAQPVVENGAYHLDGWACISGERMLKVDCWVLLYSPEEDRYYRLPTLAGILTEEATETLDDGTIYGRAGYSAVASLKNLREDFSEFEICFAYRSNEHNNIIHTGQLAMEGSAA